MKTIPILLLFSFFLLSLLLPGAAIARQTNSNSNSNSTLVAFVHVRSTSEMIAVIATVLGILILNTWLRRK